MSSMHDPDWVYTASAASDVGSVRRLNEDAVLADDAAHLWCVADGMGGHSGGDVASAAVVSALANLPPGRDLATRQRQAVDALTAVNDRLYTDALERGTVVGSTVAVLLAEGAGLVALWAGDSRVGRLRGGTLRWLTRDHSQVQDLLDQGRLSPEDALRHPARNVITRAIGAQDTLELDSVNQRAEPDDTYLLCTDGLVNAVPDDRIATLLRGPSVQRCARELIHTALANRARDNVSVVVVRVEPDPMDITRPLRLGR